MKVWVHTVALHNKLILIISSKLWKMGDQVSSVAVKPVDKLVNNVVLYSEICL